MIRLSQNHPWQLVGIVSHSKGCGQSNAAMVYTRIATYLDWIETKREQRRKYLITGVYPNSIIIIGRDGFSDSSSNLVNI